MNKNNRTQWREWESHEAHQYVCNDVVPNSDAFVSELRITSSGKDILPDLVARTSAFSFLLLNLTAVCGVCAISGG